MIMRLIVLYKTQGPARRLYTITCRSYDYTVYWKYLLVHCTMYNVLTHVICVVTGVECNNNHVLLYYTVTNIPFGFYFNSWSPVVK